MVSGIDVVDEALDGREGCVVVSAKAFGEVEQLWEGKWDSMLVCWRLSVRENGIGGVDRAVDVAWRGWAAREHERRNGATEEDGSGGGAVNGIAAVYANGWINEGDSVFHGGV